MPDGDADAAWARYAAHLDEVSRSFAKCIAGLKAPLREWVGLGYLLCRLLDTVEDAPWPSATAQDAHFVAALDFVDRPASKAAIASFVDGVPKDIAPGERALLHDAPWLFAELHALEPGPRAAIVATFRRMAAGMRYYAGRRDAAGAVRLQSLADVNRYCFVVAGVVGQMLTSLLVQARTHFVPPTQMHRDAVHFGLFLQKVNLLKDQLQDERAGRFWLPEREQVCRSLHDDARGASRYLLSIPTEAADFRLFCAWSLLLGAYSLQAYQQSPAQEVPQGLPRAQSAALYTQLAACVHDDAALREALDAALTALPAVPTGSPRAVMASADIENFAVWRARLGPVLLEEGDAKALGLA